MAVKKKLTFEQQLNALEALIAQMEAGGMSLEESVKQYESGVKMLDELEKTLGEVAQRLTVIRKGENGQDEEQPLEVQP